MAIPLLAMALGGAALGALANPEDRKKGALLGLGAGLLGPALGAAGIGSGGVLGTGLGAGTTTTAAAAPTALAGASNAGANIAAQAAGKGLAQTGLQGFAASGAPVGIQSVLPGAGIGAGGVAHTGTVGSKLSAMGTAALDAGKKAATKTGEYLAEEGPDMAKDLGMQGAVMAMQPQPQQQAPAGRSMALRGQQQDGVSLYDQAAMKTQARMKQRTAPRRYI